jgi:hypothetical protein
MGASNDLTSQSQFLTLEAVEALIKQGHVLVIGASNALLHKLPQGDWIGGSAKYFLFDNAPQENDERLMVADLTPYVTEVRSRVYSEYGIHNLAADRYAHGFSLALLPAFSAIHRAFALYAVTNMPVSDSPLTGWVTSEEMDPQGESIPKAYSGTEGRYFVDKAVVMHCRLREDYMAQLGILNPYVADTGDVLRFDDTGFTIVNCLVNGQYQNLAEYWRSHNLAPTSPLMADIQGMPSMLHPLDSIGRKSVTFSAPVIPGVEYRIAQCGPEQLSRHMQQLAEAKALHPLFSIHCLAHYHKLLEQLQGQDAPDGVFSAGEIANVLMNRTSVVLYLKHLAQ